MITILFYTIINSCNRKGNRKDVFKILIKLRLKLLGYCFKDHLIETNKDFTELIMIQTQKLSKLYKESKKEKFNSENLSNSKKHEKLDKRNNKNKQI